MDFVFEKRGREHLLTEKNEIKAWRRNYLLQMKKFRQEGRKIYYLDETWVNAGHTHQKIWKDKTIITVREAYRNGLSVGLKNPSGKGKRLIIGHIGSDTGFVDGGMLVFESKKTGDYHEDMNSSVFCNWMQTILPLLEPGCVIVMDNAPYHSVKLDKPPTNMCRKEAIRQWLLSKNINVAPCSLKFEMLDMVKKYIQDHPVRYAIDTMVKRTGIFDCNDIHFPNVLQRIL